MLRSGRTAARRGRRATAYAVASFAAAAALAVSGSASAQTTADGTGGATQPAPSASKAPPTAPQPAAARLGTTPFGVRPIRPAKLRSVRCLAGCADARTPLTDARLRLRGRGLRGTDMIIFLGGTGDADDVEAMPLRTTRTAVDVRVPLGAASGPVTVADRDGIRAAASLPLTIAPGAAAAPRTLVAGGPRVDAQVANPRSFFDSAVRPHVTYVLHGGEAAPITVDVVREADRAVVASWAAG